MRTAILALIFSIPVSLTADMIGVWFGEADAAVDPCAAPVKAVSPTVMPKFDKAAPIKRPSRHRLRTA